MALPKDTLADPEDPLIPMLVWLAFLYVTHAAVYLITKNGLVVISSDSFSLHNSELKLWCLAAMYDQQPFHPDMLFLEEATALELAQLPVEQFWVHLDRRKFARMSERVGLAPILEELCRAEKLSVLRDILWGWLKCSSRQLSKFVNLALLSKETLSILGPRFLFWIDPFHLIATYNSGFAEALQVGLGLRKDLQIKWIWETHFAHASVVRPDDWAKLKNALAGYLEACQAGLFESVLDRFVYVEVMFETSFDVQPPIRSLLLALLNSIDWDSMDHAELFPILSWYSRPDGYAFKVGLHSSANALQDYIENRLDLAHPKARQCTSPAMFWGVAESMSLMGILDEEQVDLTALFSPGIGRRQNHLSPGWVESVALVHAKMQDALLSAFRWDPTFPTTLGLCQDLVRHMPTFQDDTVPLLIVLRHLVSHPEDRDQLRIPPGLDQFVPYQILRSFLGQPARDEPAGHADVTGWKDWPAGQWAALSCQEFALLVQQNGFAPLYNSISPDARVALQCNQNGLLGPSCLGRPELTAHIRFGEIDGDLLLEFGRLILPVADQGVFWSQADMAMIDRFLGLYASMGFSVERLLRPAVGMAAWLKELGTPPILTCDRRPVDVANDLLAIATSASSHRVLSKISSTYWSTCTAFASPEQLERDLKSLLTCPGLLNAHLRRRNPFWRALHECLDPRLFGEEHWRLIGMMAGSHDLGGVMATGYLLGLIDGVEGVEGLPLPAFTRTWSTRERLGTVQACLQHNPQLQSGLLGLVRWDPAVLLPPSLLDQVVERWGWPGYRRDLILLVLHQAVTAQYTYEGTATSTLTHLINSLSSSIYA